MRFLPCCFALYRFLSAQCKAACISVSFSMLILQTPALIVYDRDSLLFISIVCSSAIFRIRSPILKAFSILVFCQKKYKLFSTYSCCYMFLFYRIKKRRKMYNYLISYSVSIGIVYIFKFVNVK